MSSVYYCAACRQYHDALTEEIASYTCLKSPKSLAKRKKLDDEIFNKLTEIFSSIQDTNSKAYKSHSHKINGVNQYGNT